MRSHITTFRSETGQTTTEYGIVLGVITIGVVLALTSLSNVIVKSIQNVVGLIP